MSTKATLDAQMISAAVLNPTQVFAAKLDQPVILSFVAPLNPTQTFSATLDNVIHFDARLL